MVIQRRVFTITAGELKVVQGHRCFPGLAVEKGLASNTEAHRSFLY